MIGRSRLFFWPGSPEFQIDGIRSSVVDWVAMVQSLVVDATNILDKDILLGIPKENFAFLQPNVTDRPSGSKPNAGFAASRNLDTSASSDAFKRIMSIFLQNPIFKKRMMLPDESGELHGPGLITWLRAVVKFKENIFLPLHMACGAPKRVTETLRNKAFDTDTRSRNFYWILDRILIIGDYSKTSAITGSDKKTIHIVPPALQDILLIFFMVVLPLEIYFIRELGLDLEGSPNWHCYLFSSFAKRWSEDFARYLAKKCTKKYLGCTFGIAQIRHVIPGTVQAYYLDWMDAMMSYEYRKQAGHSPAIGGRLYAQDGKLLGLVTSDEAKAALGFSERYHSFWGLDNENGPVQRTAEDLEVFRSPVGTLGWVRNELEGMRGRLSELRVSSCFSSSLSLHLRTLSNVLNATCCPILMIFSSIC